MVHSSDLHKLVEKGEFSFEYIEKDGSVLIGERCICTSWHSEGTTMNVKFCDSGEIRTLTRKAITKYNGQEVSI